MHNVSISSKIKRNYIDYSVEVNSSRSIPLVFDGLKIVQRRLLLTGADIAKNKLAKSASLIGECMAHYHPHGDSSLYGALVGLVNDNYPMFIGQGNWGDIDTGPAAYRYTSARLSDFSNEYFTKYLKYSDMSENELGNLENSYIPTKIPYALVNGASGIGVGVATSIPSFSLQSVLDYVNYLLSPSGKSEPELHLNYPSYDMDQKILSTGYGRIKYNIVCHREDDKTIVITRHTPGSNVKAILTSQLKAELDAKKLFIRDESGPAGTRIVVGKIWWVNMQDIEEKIKKSSKAITVSMNWATGTSQPLVRRLAPRHVLEISLEKYVKAVDDWKAFEISKINKEIRFQENKPEVLKHLFEGKTWSQIQTILQLSDEDLTFIKGKSVSQLSKESTSLKDQRQLIKQINQVKP